MTGLRVLTVFTCDSKPAAWRWVESKGPHEIQDLLVDMRKVAANLQLCPDRHKPDVVFVKLEGFCALHGKKHTLWLENGAVDCIVSGLSCKPFSCARSKSFSAGTEVHQDADLHKARLAIVKAVEPKFAIVENVNGVQT